MRKLSAVIAAIALASCGSKVPEIARDLPGNYAEGEKVFDARLKSAFPVGSSEADLIRNLSSQGFEIRKTSSGPFATFNDRSFPVQNVWHVGWEASDGQISKVWGVCGGRGP